VTFPEYVRPKMLQRFLKKYFCLFFQYGGWKPTHNRQMTKNSMLTVIWFLEHIQMKFQLHIYVYIHLVTSHRLFIRLPDK